MRLLQIRKMKLVFLEFDSKFEFFQRARPKKRRRLEEIPSLAEPCKKKFKPNMPDVTKPPKFVLNQEKTAKLPEPADPQLQMIKNQLIAMGISTMSRLVKLGKFEFLWIYF